MTVKLIKQAQEYALQFRDYDKPQIFYTFADVGIIPTFLTQKISRKDIKVEENFKTIKNNTITIFPAFGSAMAFMRSKFAKDLAKENGILTLPRVSLSENERLSDIDYCEVPVGVSLGVKEEKQFIKKVISKENVVFLSIDIAHAATPYTLDMLKIISDLNISNGVIAGTVGSVQGLAFLYKIMDEMGFEEKIFRVGIGGGAACTTRVNTGVGVGQMTLLENVWRFIQEQNLTDVKIISDGGMNGPGDFAKALTRSHGTMGGKIFASKSYEDDVIVEKDGVYYAIYYGMASARAKASSSFVEGGEIPHPLKGENAMEICQNLRQGVQSAMTYVNAFSLKEFRENAVLAINSGSSIIESNIH